MRYRLLAEKADGSEVIIANADSPGLAHIIAEHLVLVHPDYEMVTVQERRMITWRTVRVVPKEVARRTVQINDMVVRYIPA